MFFQNRQYFRQDKRGGNSPSGGEIPAAARRGKVRQAFPQSSERFGLFSGIGHDVHESGNQIVDTDQLPAALAGLSGTRQAASSFFGSTGQKAAVGHLWRNVAQDRVIVWLQAFQHGGHVLTVTIVGLDIGSALIHSPSVFAVAKRRRSIVLAPRTD